VAYCQTARLLVSSQRPSFTRKRLKFNKTAVTLARSCNVTRTQRATPAKVSHIACKPSSSTVGASAGIVRCGPYVWQGVAE